VVENQPVKLIHRPTIPGYHPGPTSSIAETRHLGYTAVTLDQGIGLLKGCLRHPSLTTVLQYDIETDFQRNPPPLLPSDLVKEKLDLLLDFLHDPKDINHGF
jgi:hypothetical protein